MSKATKLSDAQWTALRSFAAPGGHGYGEYAYLRKPTARALARLGLVELTRREIAYQPSIPWGYATEAGKALLAKRDAEKEADWQRWLAARSA